MSESESKSETRVLHTGYSGYPSQLFPLWKWFWSRVQGPVDVHCTAVILSEGTFGLQDFFGRDYYVWDSCRSLAWI
jgi:hypothetical protein